MNQFCKVALDELLGLKLSNCLIEKRLFPVVDYLQRHRVALQKYVYPDCFCAIMEHVWESLLQVSLTVWCAGCMCCNAALMQCRTLKMRLSS
jgi:hypothetical protein